MIKTITRILTLIVIATATLSCAQAFLGENESLQKGDLKIIVSGVASDVTTNSPLTGIKITFDAYPASNTHNIIPLATKTVYTDSNGVYTVEVGGFSENITCTLTAECTNQNQIKYEAQTNRVHVSWNGLSFDQSKGVFVVNDCNFQLKKAR